LKRSTDWFINKQSDFTQNGKNISRKGAMANERKAAMPLTLILSPAGRGWGEGDSVGM
jgi:hypothetical protein